jgi:hypothetical protein
MFEILTKINILFSLLKYFKEYKIVSIICSIFLFSVYLLYKGLSIYADNSIYKDNKEDTTIKEGIKQVLSKCGNKHAIGISTISTDIKTDYYAKFKEIMSCDFKINPSNCIVDLTADQFPFAGDYLVDSKTYAYLQKLANQEDAEKIYLPEFDMDNYPTIKALLEKSIHYKSGEMKYLFLTAVNNYEKNIIYSVSLTSWSKEPCENAKYLLNKFKENLPIKK